MQDSRYPTEGDNPVTDPLREAKDRMRAIAIACQVGADTLEPSADLDAALLLMLAEIAAFARSAMAFIDQAASETVG